MATTTFVHDGFDNPLRPRKKIAAYTAPSALDVGLNRQQQLMAAARAKTSFDVKALNAVIFGSATAALERERNTARVEREIDHDDFMKLPRIYGDLDRSAQYQEGLRWAKVLREDSLKHGHHQFARTTHRYTLVNASPFGLHPLMFIPSLKLQADAEQLAYWLPLAESGKIIGTYCQTEMGHGTFVRGLETTATFDPQTDEIIVHSPTVSSTKYWPGGLGFSCSHALVMARLIVRGTDHGVHPFIVQLRSLDDWKPLPGIEVGDIGLKIGYNSADNGYAIFDKVRIPRRHMLMGHSKLSRDGIYTKAPHDKAAYSTMTYTRNVIVETVSFQLAQAATIAIRYSTVREQGAALAAPGKESTIISYKSQHYRLLSILSRAYACLFASKACDEIYQEVASLQSRGDFSMSNFGHVTTAALKAYATQVAADGTEDARKACGGHGYSVLSGLPEIVATATPMATLEGENFVMYQQTARYLVKAASALRNGGKVDGALSYLADGFARREQGRRRPTGISDFSDPDVQLEAFEHRATRLILECEELLRSSQENEGLSYEEAWNLHMMQLITAARAHAELFVLQSFLSSIPTSPSSDPSVIRVLQRLCTLYALTSIESPSSPGSLGFFEDGYITPSSLRSIRTLVHSTLDSLLPDAIGLTDAWNFSDNSLGSALGRRDGNVYETLLEWTRQVPLNLDAGRSGGVDKSGWEGVIAPMLGREEKEKVRAKL